MILDTELRITYANAVFAGDLGWVASELSGRSVLEAVDGQVDARTIATLVEVARSGRPWLGEADRRLADGTVGRVQIRVTPRRAVDGTLEGFVIVARDVSDLRRGEEALRQSDERLRRFLDASIVGTIVARPAGAILEANDYFLDLVGRTRDELERGALDWRAISPPEWLVVSDRAIDETRAGGTATPYQKEYLRSDGTRVPVLVAATTLPGPDDLLAAVVLDLTHTTEQIRERERLVAAIEQSADGIVITDPDLRIVYANAAYAASVGHVPHDLVGTGAREVAGIGLDRTTLAALERSVRAGQRWFREVDHRLPDGSLRRLEANIAPTYDASGVTSWVGVMRDVTERHRAEAERARLATAVEQAADFIIVNDPNGKIQSVNPAFERLTGYSRDEVLGLPVRSVLRSGVDPPEVYAGLDDALRRGEPWACRLAERRADGDVLEVDLSVSPIRDAAGGLIGTVEIGRDRTHERQMEAELALEAQVRAALTDSVHNVPEDATLEQAAQAICDQLVTLPFVDVAGIDIALGADSLQIIAQRAPPGSSVSVGDRIPPARAATIRERAHRGAWAEYVTADPAEGFFAADVGRLKALAYGPIMRGAEMVGCLTIGTLDEHFAHTLVGRMPGVVSFSATSSALLAERLHTRRQQRERHDSLEAILAARAFHPVFQPIVDLETGEMVGYEALTRFDSGQRPDLAFADAWSVDLGMQLEFATLEAAVAAAKRLPAGVWLDLNVSPRLFVDVERLSEVLWPAERPLVLEITEHDVIEDYAALSEAVRALGHDVRLAVDDAGAGVANFGHIIELSPDFVKLDISLVRRVNANMGRQAMVIGMRHFSRTSGCRLVAEGIETEEEAATLRALGVEFGQGYMFGRPEPVEVWTTTGTAGDRGAAGGTPGLRAAPRQPRTDQ